MFTTKKWLYSSLDKLICGTSGDFEDSVCKLMVRVRSGTISCDRVNDELT